MMLVDKLGLEDQEEVYEFVDGLKDEREDLIEASVSWETMSDNDKSEVGIVSIEKFGGATFVVLITPATMRYIPVGRVYEVEPKE